MPVQDGYSSSGAKREHFNSKARHTITKKSKGNNTADSEWDVTQNSLRQALAANRELQEKMLSELARIARRKRDNRLEAERCIERSCAVVLQGEITGSTNTNAPLTTDEGESKSKQEDNNDRQEKDLTDKKTKKRKKKKYIKGDAEYVPSNDDVNELLAGDGKSSRDNTIEAESNKNNTDSVGDAKTQKQKWSLHLRKKFKFDPYRKWTSEFFIDPTGSRPKENDDSIRRRKLMMKRKHQNILLDFTQQQQGEDELVPDTFFYHTSQPFTPKERSLLDKWLFQDGDRNNHKWAENENGEPNAFYDQIAQKLRRDHHENPVERKKDKVLFPTCLPRSAEDIRLYHKHRLASQYEFTKEESLAILECVEEASAQWASEGESRPRTHNEKNETNRIQNPTIERPDWQKICDRVLEVHRQNNCVTNKIPPITPYQCMVHYKRKLRPQPDGSFTPEEDELLLRYIAAMGPQFVWGYPQITDLASRLFPHKTSRRIYERTHFSQWHPLSKDSIWTKEEEMKLVLAMKIYSDTPSDDSSENNDGNDNSSATQNLEKSLLASEKSSLRKAAAHFHPYRQSYKVAKKWERSFSPRFSYKPFSKEEDKQLLAAVRSSATTTPFSEIARKHFPDRSSDQLSQRWAKIAPDKEIVKKYVPSMVRSGLKRGLLSTKSGRNVFSTGEATNGEQSRGNVTTENNSNALFETSDFVVEVLGDETLDGTN
mmetsp:Transcript_20046/g.49886  ORF Transcript_20046/g.49886 Transcript_20046/m.49886 type:complete len:713 (-) Transcript_20046:77-2215(-)